MIDDRTVDYLMRGAFVRVQHYEGASYLVEYVKPNFDEPCGKDVEMCVIATSKANALEAAEMIAAEMIASGAKVDIYFKPRMIKEVIVKEKIDDTNN